MTSCKDIICKLFVGEGDEIHYFKRVQKFPRVFEDAQRKITVWKDGTMDIKDMTNEGGVYFCDSLPILDEALAFSKRCRELKDEAKQLKKQVGK